MYHASARASHQAGHRTIPPNDLLHDFSTHVERYARTNGCYPLAEPWYSAQRVIILSSRTTTHTQLAAFENELHERIQHDLPSLCAPI